MYGVKKVETPEILHERRTKQKKKVKVIEKKLSLIDDKVPKYYQPSIRPQAPLKPI